MSSDNLKEEDFPPLLATLYKGVPEDCVTPEPRERISVYRVRQSRYKLDFGPEDTPEVALEKFMGSIPVEDDEDKLPLLFEYNSLHGGRRIPIYAPGFKIEFLESNEDDGHPMLDFGTDSSESIGIAQRTDSDCEVLSGAQSSAQQHIPGDGQPNPH